MARSRSIPAGSIVYANAYFARLMQRDRKGLHRKHACFRTSSRRAARSSKG